MSASTPQPTPNSQQQSVADTKHAPSADTKAKLAASTPTPAAAAGKSEPQYVFRARPVSVPETASELRYRKLCVECTELVFNMQLAAAEKSLVEPLRCAQAKINGYSGHELPRLMFHRALTVTVRALLTERKVDIEAAQKALEEAETVCFCFCLCVCACDVPALDQACKCTAHFLMSFELRAVHQSTGRRTRGSRFGGHCRQRCGQPLGTDNTLWPAACVKSLTEFRCDVRTERWMGGHFGPQTRRAGAACILLRSQCHFGAHLCVSRPFAAAHSVLSVRRYVPAFSV